PATSGAQVVAPDTAGAAGAAGLAATATKAAVAEVEKPTRVETPATDDDAKKAATKAATTREPKKKPGDGAKTGEGADSAATVTAFGYVTIGAQPYALVRIDGQEVGVTPIMRKKLPAGPHEIQLVSPDTGEVRLKKSVTLADGEHQRITYP
ncbi:PEGA domain-containing protein, partial [Myxococcota bacterium]|nr:PEGA domain-containing protein [Myxococcota bacterium]